MKLVDVASLYALVGLGCAVAVLWKGGLHPPHTLDAALLLLFWPLHGPFILGRPASRKASPFMDTGARVQHSTLASLFPDEKSVSALATRLEDAAGKVLQIDQLLQQPEFSEERAVLRRQELLDRGDARSAATVASRLQDIRRLSTLRRRYARELDEVGELLAKLRIQAELVRLVGEPDGQTRELMQELMTRVDGLDAIMDDEDLNPAMG